MITWHVWMMNHQRFNRVREYLDEIEGIETYLYPTISKEVISKGGKHSTKKVPLYSNYIFIKYRHTPKLFVELSDCPWLKGYVGVCSDDEVKSVRDLTFRKYEDLVPTSDLRVGGSYKLYGTIFKGMTCTVREINNDKLVVSVTLFGSDRLVRCSIDDIILEG